MRIDVLSMGATEEQLRRCRKQRPRQTDEGLPSLSCPVREGTKMAGRRALSANKDQTHHMPIRKVSEEEPFEGVAPVSPTSTIVHHLHHHPGRAIVVLPDEKKRQVQAATNTMSNHAYQPIVPWIFDDVDETMAEDDELLGLQVLESVSVDNMDYSDDDEEQPKYNCER